MSSFSDPDAVARYAENTARIVPGFRDMQAMSALLLAEPLGDTAHILVLGAGGGLELKAYAEFRPGWRFMGVDPSSEMLSLAAQVNAAHLPRIRLHQGYIESAPQERFDGAACLLTLHFVAKDARLRTLVEIRSRLKPGAPFVMAHHSFSQDPPEKELWLNRYAAYVAGSGVPIEKARMAAEKIGQELPVLSPEVDEALLREAGFDDINLFYAGLTFRGWRARAA